MAGLALAAQRGAAVVRSWESREQPAHDWARLVEAKRKELQRLTGAYKNTLSNAKVRPAVPSREGMFAQHWRPHVAGHSD